ncbi:hypothetical protein Vretimale_11239 [Volvox reticuliferus]|uniref:Cap-specific mRNA (nucleoside-2'-O-)-methyltransferase 1 n=1 Tax=Volvox reticuliferus TaxID=1737510 RepID=A0A8J4CN18_9CHLO|nr:hypothetical protein Vretifemale_12219 [Volvox reticuliferus]GIM07031.1 hypothetical protein Vretimale_11239 [Volvox reticuliferus]
MYTGPMGPVPMVLVPLVPMVLMGPGPNGHMPTAMPNPMPVPGGPMPVPGGPMPVPGGPMPVPGGPMPVPGGPMPVPGGPMPVPGGPMPVPRGPMPVPGGPMLVPGGPMPVPGGPMSVPGGPRPIPGGPRPVPGGPMPIPGGPMPVPGGPMPIPGGPRPVPGGPMPVSGVQGFEQMSRGARGGGGGGNGDGRGGGAVAGGGGGRVANSGAVLKAMAATRKKTAAGQEMRHEMRERMRYIMFEIDQSNGDFICGRNEPFQFLDVCCCPGGFSTYLITAGPAPRKGIGFSLPPELGGHLPAIPQETDKYLLHFVDVTTVAAGVRVGDMAVGIPGCPRHALQLNAAPDAPPASNCQLVILDGSFLGGKDWIHKETTLPDSENPAFNVYGSETAAHKALLIAQLIIMANNLAPGGALVLRLNMFADLFTAGVLGLLRHVFQGDVSSYKPRSCHVHRGSYYLVCTGFNPLKAYGMQWVPRWNACLAELRKGGMAPRFVPFPGLQLNTQSTLETVWTRALYVYHVHLWRFSKLVEVAMEEKAILDHRMPDRPREGRFTHICGRIFAGVGCHATRCRAAHSFEELHPFVQKAFREPRGFLFMPGSVALAQAPLPSTDPLPETLLELKQQAHMQAVLQAQAAAARQQDALAAAAHAASGNVFGYVGSYDTAVEMGMGGEWVHGMFDRQGQRGNPSKNTQAAPAATSVSSVDDTELRQIVRTVYDDHDIVLEGGFEEEDVGLRGSAEEPGPLPKELPRPPAAEDAQSAAEAVTRDADLEFAATLEIGGKSVSERETNIRPELLRMSGYQPRLGLVTIEIEDEESMDALPRQRLWVAVEGLLGVQELGRWEWGGGMWRETRDISVADEGAPRRQHTQC